MLLAVVVVVMAVMVDMGMMVDVMVMERGGVILAFRRT